MSSRDCRIHSLRKIDVKNDKDDKEKIIWYGVGVTLKRDLNTEYVVRKDELNKNFPNSTMETLPAQEDLEEVSHLCLALFQTHISDCGQIRSDPE